MAILVKSDSARNFKEKIMEPTPANMQSFETVQSVLLWAQLKATRHRRRLTFGC